MGPDLVGGFVGSEGRFGIALEITLRLLPRPAGFRTVLAAYRSLEAAGDAVSRIVRSGLLPGAMEIMDHLAIQAAEAAVHAGYPLDAAAVLLVDSRARPPTGRRGVRAASMALTRRPPGQRYTGVASRRTRPSAPAMSEGPQVRRSRRWGA